MLCRACLVKGETLGSRARFGGQTSGTFVGVRACPYDALRRVARGMRAVSTAGLAAAFRFFVVVFRNIRVHSP